MVEETQGKFDRTADKLDNKRACELHSVYQKKIEIHLGLIGNNLFGLFKGDTVWAIFNSVLNKMKGMKI